MPPLLRRTLPLLLLATAARAADPTALRELAPTGTLRVAIALAPAGSAFWATRDPSTGRPRGVTVDLATALAAELGLPLALPVLASSGAITAAVADGTWDATFVPRDADRERVLAFGPDYFVSTSTCLVPAGSPITALAAVNQPGVRLVGITGTTTLRTAARAFPAATLTEVGSVEAILALLRAGTADAAALGRESLAGLAPLLPGARVLDGAFHTAGTAIAVPPGRPAALALATAFMESAKAAGTVRRALDTVGIAGAVAPPAARP